MEDRKQTQTLFHSWGTAKFLYSDSTVTVKELNFATLAKTSLHYHVYRRETLYVQSGSFNLRVFSLINNKFETVPLYPGMSYMLSRGGIHQIECLKEGKLIETTLTYDEEDVIRIFNESMITGGVPSLR